MSLTLARGTRPGSVSEESAVRARISALEKRFGNRTDLANPLRDTALLYADEQGRTPDAALQLLADYRLGAEFVPTELGGRFVQVDSVCWVLRTVFRHDTGLGLAQGASLLCAVTPVWAAGSDEQRARLARLLLGGGRLAVTGVHAEDDGVADDVPAAQWQDGGYVLHGRGEGCSDVPYADALLVFARTGLPPGPHSALLLHAAELRDADGGRGEPGSRMTAQPRFAGHSVSGSALVGAEGEGGALARRALLLAGSALPAMAIGAADRAVRVAVDFAHNQQVLGRPVLDVPYHRSLFAGAFIDLLIGDCLTLAATRCLHALPAEAGAVAEAARLVVPKLLGRAVGGLAAVLGPTGSVRDGRYGMFNKQLRDLERLPTPSLTGPMALAARLPGFARHAWLRGTPAAPDTVFTPGESLPPLDWRGPGHYGPGDPLAASLIVFAEDIKGRTDLEPYGRTLGALCGALVDELRDLAEDCARLGAEDLSVPHPRAHALAHRYALILAATACLGVYRSSKVRTGFLAEPAWATAALHRIVVRLGRDVPPLPPVAEREVVAELLARHRSNRTFDVYETPLAG